MPLMRPSSSALRASRCLAHHNNHSKTIPGTLAINRGHQAAATAPRTAAASASISSSARAAAAADHASHDDDAASHEAHEDHYDPPGGWLWGIKPGDKYEKEGWEGIWVWGFFGSLGLGVVAYAFKPDTSIQTWALEEARRRLEVEGILKEPESKP